MCVCSLRVCLQIFWFLTSHGAKVSALSTQTSMDNYSYYRWKLSGRYWLEKADFILADTCLRVLRLQRLLAVPGPAPLGEVVHRGKLDEGGKDKGVADGYEPIHGGGVGHLGKRVPGADAERGHGQHSGHP